MGLPTGEVMNEDFKNTASATQIDPQFRTTVSTMTRHMRFLGMLSIICGSISCATIVGALVGIPCIFIGIRMRQASADFDRYSGSGTFAYLSSAIERQARVFFIQYVLAIISIIFTVIYLVIAIFIITGSVGHFSRSNLGNGSTGGHPSVSSWIPHFNLPWNKAYRISPASKNILKNLDDVILVKVCFSRNLPPNLHKTVTDVRGMLNSYNACARRKLRVSWIDPSESESLKKEALSMGIPEIQLQTIERNKTQVINGSMGIAVLYADRKEIIPVVQNIETLEYDLTLAIKKVSRSTPPKIGLLKLDTLPEIPLEHDEQMSIQPERTNITFKPLIEKLKVNYDVAMVDVSKGKHVDSTIVTLVVPRSAPLSDRDLFEIDQFFMRGGNLIALANSTKVVFRDNGPAADSVDTKLLDLLQFYGAKIERNMVLDATCGQVNIQQKVGAFNMNVPVPYPYFVRVGAEGMNRDIPALAALPEVVLTWPNTISLLVEQTTSGAQVEQRNSVPVSQNPGGVTATILAHSSPKSWTASGSVDLDPAQKWEAPAEVKPSVLAVYLHGGFKSYFAGKQVPSVKIPAQQAVFVDGGRAVIPSNDDGHLIVIANASFVTGQNATPGNLSMVTNLVDWLSQDKGIISLRTRAVKKTTEK
jgi:ABC-2 type transport system permease protein